MDHKAERSIIEDLLPLYEEGLLSEETTDWFEKTVNAKDEYKALVRRANHPLPKKEIRSPINNEKMFKKIYRKLSAYQMIFVAISFFLAINTSILNDSFGFILWYAVLGFLTYVFYKDMKMVFLFSFIPIFIWGLSTNISEFIAGNVIGGLSFGQFIMDALLGNLLLASIHYVFALIGSMIALLRLKLKERS